MKKGKEEKNSTGQERESQIIPCGCSIGDEAGAVSVETDEVIEGQRTDSVLFHNRSPSGFYSVDKGEFVRHSQAWKWLQVWISETCW